MIRRQHLCDNNGNRHVSGVCLDLVWPPRCLGHCWSVLYCRSQSDWSCTFLPPGFPGAARADGRSYSEPPTGNKEKREYTKKNHPIFSRENKDASSHPCSRTAVVSGPQVGHSPFVVSGVGSIQRSCFDGQKDDWTGKNPGHWRLVQFWREQQKPHQLIWSHFTDRGWRGGRWCTGFDLTVSGFERWCVNVKTDPGSEVENGQTRIE